MGKTKNPATAAAVFEEFMRITREYRDKYGEIATRIDRQYMYEQAAKLFNISPKYAGQLIRHVMQNPKVYAGYKQEALELMEFLRNCHTPMDKFR